MANNRIAYGLCKKYGIKLRKGATPGEAWEALKKNGYTANDDSEEYIEPKQYRQNTSYSQISVSSKPLQENTQENPSDLEKNEPLCFDSLKEIRDFFFFDGEERGLLAKQNSKHGQWKKSLTPYQEKVIGEYAADGYSNINSYLRGYDNGKYYSIDHIRRKIKALDETIASYELKSPIITYRSINSWALLPFGKDISSLINTEYSDPAFMSTTPYENSPALNKELIMRISLPKGKGIGAYLDTFNQFGEEEFLLARGSTFRITNAYEEKSGFYIVEMELKK